MSRSSILRSIAGRVQNVAPMMDTVSSSSLATFATKAAAPSPKLPPQFGIPGRYAAALYMASFKAGTLSNIEKEVSALRSVLGASAELKAFVSEPGMPAKTRSAGLGAVLDKVGVKDATVKRFLDVVVENKRTSDLEGMLSKFQEIAAQQRGEVKASVTTAKALGKAELDSVKSGLANLLKKGESLVLEERVDPSIISGIVIDIGDRHVDMSVSTRVKKLQNLIRNA